MKRVGCLLLTICLCLCLSGCGLFDDISRGIKGASIGFDVDGFIKDVRDDTADAPLTEATREAAAEALLKSKELEAVQQEDKWRYHIPFGIGDSIHDSHIANAEAEFTRAQGNYEAAYNNDEARLAYEADRREEREKKDEENKSTLIKGGIIVAIILVIFLMLILLKKTPKAKATAPAPALPQSKPEALPDHKALPDVKANTMVACRKMAAKYGLDADQELVKYNGDVDKLYNSLVAMTPLDD